MATVPTPSNLIRSPALKDESDNGECDQETQDQDAGLNQSSHQQSDSLNVCAAVVPNAAPETCRLPQVAETQKK